MREIIYGRNAVRECLRAGRRQFFRLILAEGLRQTDRAGAGPPRPGPGARDGVREGRAPGVGEILRAAERRRLPVQTAPRASLDQSATAPGGNPQGVALEVSGYPYAALGDIIALARSRGEPPFILLLDLLQDPQNAGALLRAAEAVGAHGAVLQDRRSVEITPAVVNASAGATEHLLIARETNLARAMDQLKEHGLWLTGLDADGETRLDQADLSGPLGLVIGSEGEGLRRLVREKCDRLVRLPMRGNVASLNAATAGSVALYYAWEARGFRGAVEKQAEGNKGNRGNKGTGS
jgi:23S rRNA (guanosine2251-2'-O)-methyltransferase